MQELEEMKKEADKLFQEAETIINKYKRKTCIKCDMKEICAGECEKTI